MNRPDLSPPRPPSPAPNVHVAFESSATLRRSCAAALVTLLLLLSPALAFAGDLSIEDAWIRLPPPGANTAGYMTLANGGQAPIRITGVRSDGVERLELHETVIADGVASMRRIEVIEIPAGESVTLAPRGLHLMLIRPGQLAEATPVELVFSVEGQDDVVVEVPVRREGAGH